MRRSAQENVTDSDVSKGADGVWRFEGHGTLGGVFKGWLGLQIGIVAMGRDGARGIPASKFSPKEKPCAKTLLSAARRPPAATRSEDRGLV